MDVGHMNVVSKWMYLYVGSGLRKLMVIITEDLSFFLVWVSQTQYNCCNKLMM